MSATIKPHPAIVEQVEAFNDNQLREELRKNGKSCGPITDSTRELYRKSLIKILNDIRQLAVSESKKSQELKKLSEAKRLQSEASNSMAETQTPDNVKNLSWAVMDKPTPYKALQDYVLNGTRVLDESTDEDFDIEDEEDESTESEAEEETDESEFSRTDIEDDDDDDDDDDSIEGDLSSSEKKDTRSGRRAKADSSADVNSALAGIRVLVITAFVGLFSFYLYSNSNKTSIDFSGTWQPIKHLTKYFLLLACFSPLVYVIYKTFSYFKTQKNLEKAKVYELVSKALELLQSPDTPRIVPILHLRDTLLSPPERTRDSINLWNKAVKFIESNESRVMIELHDINGESFRAWKWIGARKL